MTLSTISVAATVTPVVLKTWVSHYTNRKPRHQKPTAHISYDEGLNLIRSFLDHAAHHTVEELQAFTSQWVPHPRWVKVDSVAIPAEQIAKAADVLIEQLGHRGINQVGGNKWWQWRRKGAELKADWIEMRGDYNTRMKNNDRGRRVMLYVHGGGYFFGSVDEHRYQMQRHARKLRARVFAPRYRLAPQFPFPCGLQDCLAAYMYLLSVQEASEIILAGDSAGGGMVLSILVILRDRGLPPPAGALLISPWVDPTHSFPSVAEDSEFDYIPPRGFMQKPSPSWPPPNDDEIQMIAESAVGQVAANELPGQSAQETRKSVEQEAIKGFAVYHHSTDNEAARESPNSPAGDSDLAPRAGNTIPGLGHQLSIELDGKLVVIKDQIQMYTTNQLLSHPLVAPVLQPSLGGLPPLLILTGGGEILRDEQIYLAHKAANPEKYPPGDAYLDKYDPERTLLHKFQPTDVQLQVWEDLCHVAPTLSFTRPAKFMYRSIAQFGAWALARAQNTSIEITDDDDVSVISSGSDTDSETHDSLEKPSETKLGEKKAEQVGKAGDPLPAFKDHMIRQRVDRHGVIYPLAPAEELPAMQMPASDVGAIKPGPVKKWLEAKKEWDQRYAREKRKVQKQRIKDMAQGGSEGFGAGEQAPPSALAGRRKRYEMGEEKRKRKSYGLMMWSMFGSKHDELTIQREEDVAQREERDNGRTSSLKPSKVEDQDTVMDRATTDAHPDDTLSPTSTKGKNRHHIRRRTVTVTDAGQTEGRDSGSHKQGSQPVDSGNGTKPIPTDSDVAADPTMLSPPFIPPKYRNKGLDLLKDDDKASVSTGFEAESLRNASTTAVFAAPGVLTRECKATNAPNLSAPLSPGQDVNTDGMRSEVASTMRPDTPVSTRSNERLQSHQEVLPGHLRSPSAVAVIRAPGVISPVDHEGGSAAPRDNLEEKEGMSRKGDKANTYDASAKNIETYLEAEVKGQEKGLSSGSENARPGMYERSDTEFKTATEVL